MTQMRHRALGSSSIRVSQLCLGTLDYQWTAEEEALARSLVLPGHPPRPASRIRIRARGGFRASIFELRPEVIDLG